MISVRFNHMHRKGDIIFVCHKGNTDNMQCLLWHNSSITVSHNTESNDMHILYTWIHCQLSNKS